ncbi:uncharacterized protein LOC110738179 [Chenopodium quinoa]|uniref:uncharacterized protein LOC110738179 n=1 Tax=Chenopodium quinoa TaxID=63459 RepID=UPI000B790EF3|nr:uncharacterized protein LOC110738179 [Chenopodium quinoa]
MQQQQEDVPRQRKRREVIPRNREATHDQLVVDYFSEQPLYGDDKFRRRFRMRKPLFMKIVNQLSETDRFFQQHPDASMRLGASPIQKCTAAIRMLAYGCAADQVDEYLKLRETTARHCITHFVDGVIREFSAEYLRKPTPEDMNRLLIEGDERGFPVLQARFAIIRRPALAWSVEMLWKIVMACIIMHNMIVEDERESYLNYWDPNEFATEQLEYLAGTSNRRATTFTVTPRYQNPNLTTLMATPKNLHDKQNHMSLKQDLVEHLWAKFGHTSNR